MNATELVTIVAPATPVGRSALAVVRIDGPASSAIARCLTSGVELPARRAVHARLERDGDPLDEAIVVRYASPSSYTGNDMVELFLHGSPLVVERVIRAVMELGACAAEPGELTERAVLNGKLDLVQAEAVHDLIASRTALQARISLRQLGGALSDAAETLRSELLFLISRLEAALDFAEEGYEFITRDQVRSRLEMMIGEVDRMLATYDRGRAVANGITAVILGQPNAGKSTLLNHLCGSERAIVTEVAGTTRDLLREEIEIGGLPVTLVDTAGLRESADRVEEIGISRARAEAERAELVLYLIDASVGMDETDRRELASLSDPLMIYTKIDQAPAPAGALAISVPARVGLDELVRRLDEEVRARFVPPEGEALVVNLRQRRALDDCREALKTARESGPVSEEMLLVDLYRAGAALGALTGAITGEEIYSEIFANFCIGK